LPRYDTTATYVRGEIHERGLRLGAFSRLIFAITALVVNTLLPIFVSGISYDGKVERNHPGQLRLRRVTVFEAWTASHILLAILLLSTIFVTFKIGGMVIIGCLGLSSALMLCTPFAVIGVGIASLHFKAFVRISVGIGVRLGSLG
jgi:hypothetical protein